MKTKPQIIIFTLRLLASGLAFADTPPPIEQRVQELLGQLTLEEKVDLCYGGFFSGGVPRLGILQLTIADGRQGVHLFGLKSIPNTALLPGALTLACAWDETAAEEFGRVLGEWPATLIIDNAPVNPGQQPEERKATHGYDTEYKEGVFVGYRWFDEKKIEPQFAFGFGLSYTTFELSDPKLAEINGALQVSCVVKKTSNRTGAEVVQVYVAPPKSSVPRLPKELRGFVKITLKPGQSRRVEIALRPSALAYFDFATNKWKAVAGAYEIQVACSSRDVRLRATATLTADRMAERFQER